LDPDKGAVRLSFIVNAIFQFFELIFAANGHILNGHKFRFTFCLDIFDLGMARNRFFGILKFHNEGTPSSEHPHINVFPATAVQDTVITAENRC
jgi:hypothetical protein